MVVVPQFFGKSCCQRTKRLEVQLRVGTVLALHAAMASGEEFSGELRSWNSVNVRYWLTWLLEVVVLTVAAKEGEAGYIFSKYPPDSVNPPSPATVRRPVPAMVLESAADWC